MIAKEELLQLKTKILPTGAEYILDFLVASHEQVELTNIVLENVPLLIIGRHGMIARIYENNRIVKASHPKEIHALLKRFLQRNETLYVFINLPDLPIPEEVTQVLEEVKDRSRRKDELRRVIDAALDDKDRDLFLQASRELNDLSENDFAKTSQGYVRF
ncbi:IDEAL domain-containing protein [Alicyclobacillus sp. SO9]|uniref:IDEAL domain-containing protein n=1 Tax=Alicyclobacillus sp. SO9 TaxID=2665646 RepID=UPI0018E845F2|nr:IDEAL domain-containing protein [Alicyclobacillus sp. SO9]QQE80682.1 IDEAL domain-containing protein [Alicyclobacillus sp. SO9]